MIRSYCLKLLIRPTIAAFEMDEWAGLDPRACFDKGKTCKKGSVTRHLSPLACTDRSKVEDLRVPPRLSVLVNPLLQLVSHRSLRMRREREEAESSLRSGDRHHRLRVPYRVAVAFSLVHEAHDVQVRPLREGTNNVCPSTPKLGVA